MTRNYERIVGSAVRVTDGGVVATREGKGREKGAMAAIGSLTVVL